MATIPLARAIEYQESDGRPMAETQVYCKVMVDLLDVLERHYAKVLDVYVWGNMMFYYIKGDPEACVAPDVFLVHGVDKHERRTYKLWEEGKVPSLVIEVTSRSTKNEDLKDKKAVYERLGIAEYFLFDPLGEYLKPRLQGYRLAGGRYQPMTLAADGSLASETTGLLLAPEGKRLRLRDRASGERLLWADEEAEARQEAEEQSEIQAQRVEQERLARQAAEERVRLLEAELARLRGSSTH